MFPIDWLIVENIKNIDKVNLDEESKVRIRDFFRKVYKEEKKTRDYLEKHIRENSPGGKGAVVKMMENRENVPEDSH